MKILIYGINFAPELTGIGKYTGEMADWLAAQGHEVEVVTAPPYYPQWQVAAPYSARGYRMEDHPLPQAGEGAEFSPAFTVYRCPLWVPAKPGGLKRLLHLASFALSSLPVVLYRALRFRPDVVWVVEPALMCAPGAWLAGRLVGGKTWLHVQDFEVDAAFDLGLIKSPALKRFALWCERSLMAGFDRVSSISRNMIALAARKGVAEQQLRALPNWVDLAQVFPQDCRPDFRAELGVPQAAVVALYSGNMGGKQGLEILADVAKRVPEVFFVFCGNGPMREVLQAECAGLANVLFLDLQPLEKLNDLLNMADIHLLPQRADAADLVMPSKLTGMLASGRPVVATAHPDTELALAVQDCGIAVAPEQAALLADAVKQLAGDQALRLNLGRAARVQAEATLGIDGILRRFERDLSELVA